MTPQALAESIYPDNMTAITDEIGINLNMIRREGYVKGVTDILNQSVFVVTDPELGWDCVIAVYNSQELAIRCCLSRSGLNPDDWESYVDTLQNFYKGCVFERNIEVSFKE